MIFFILVFLNVCEGVVNSVQKIIISFLFAVLIFAGFTIASFAGLFNFVETHFYQPSKINDIHKHLNGIAHSLQEYEQKQRDDFYNNFVNLKSVKQSFASNQETNSITEREKAAGLLMQAHAGLSGIRIIEDTGRRVHYSTFSSDFLKKTETAVSYKLYKDLNETAYDKIQSPQNALPKSVYEPDKGRILYTFPFYDSFEAYRGSIIFYVAASDFTTTLIAKNTLRLTDSFFLTGTSEHPDFMLGIPEVDKSVFIQKLKEGAGSTADMQKFLTDGADTTWVLLRQTVDNSIYISQLVDENFFIFPDNVKILLLVCIFISAYLFIFLILNLKQDDLMVIRDRIKRLQLSVVSEYVNKREELDWIEVRQNIKNKKEEVRRSIKKSLGRRAKKIMNILMIYSIRAGKIY